METELQVGLTISGGIEIPCALEWGLQVGLKREMDGERKGATSKYGDGFRRFARTRMAECWNGETKSSRTIEAFLFNTQRILNILRVS